MSCRLCQAYKQHDDTCINDSLARRQTLYQKKYVLPVIILLLTVLACSLPGRIPVMQSPTPAQILQVATDMPTPVGTLAVGTESSTLEAVLPEMTETESIQYGIISGHLSYPSEFIPPQRVFAYAVNDFSVYYYIRFSGKPI